VILAVFLLSPSKPLVKFSSLRLAIFRTLKQNSPEAKTHLLQGLIIFPSIFATNAHEDTANTN
jgi:hypothetical protein